MRCLVFSSLVAGILAFPALSIAADPPLCGDVNNSNTLTSGDALAVLKASVGQNVALRCPAPATPVVSGQTVCYTEGGAEMSCVGTGQDGELQMGISRQYTDNGDGTVTDHATGLTWEKLDRSGTIHDEDNVYTWAEALKKADDLNDEAFAGHEDWRLPNIVEARSLLVYDRFSPAVAEEFDNNCGPACTAATCSCIQPDWYWTSTSYDETPADAWFVDMYNGYTDTLSKSELNFARAVRGGL